ncbi:MAG: hypothetical protein ACREN8_13090 [Candidatus Dormibacteraceae bacterium]
MVNFLPVISESVSIDRFSAYQRVAKGDDAFALALYEWNAEIAAAFWKDLGHLEILIRNVMHERLSTWSARIYGEPLWYLDPGHVLTLRHQLDIAAARKRATTGRRGKSETPGRIVAELSFGFWRYLLASHYDRTLWKPVFLGGFGDQSRRSDIHTRLTRLNGLRNRIAHHEPIHYQSLEKRHIDLLTLTKWVNLDYGTWVVRQSTVPYQLTQRPI